MFSSTRTKKIYFIFSISILTLKGGRAAFFSKGALIESNFHSKLMSNLGLKSYELLHADLNFDLTFNFTSPGSCDSFSSN